MKKLFLTAAAATFTVAFTATAAKADYLTENLVRQSHRVEAYASSLRTEFRTHFSHTSEYGHLMSDASAIASRAEGIHGLVHHIHSEGDVHRLETALRSLDKLVHHLSYLVEEASHGHGGGHVHGDTRHVFGLVSQINASIHSMKGSARALEARFHHPVPGHGHPEHGHGPEHGYVDPRARIIGGVINEVIRAAGDRRRR